MPNNSIWPIDRTLSGATTPGHSGPEKDAIEGVLCIAGASPSYRLMSYPGHSYEGILPLCRDAVSVFYNPRSERPVSLNFYGRFYRKGFKEIV